MYNSVIQALNLEHNLVYIYLITKHKHNWNEMLQNKSLYYDNPVEIKVHLPLKVGWPFTWGKLQITLTTCSLIIK